MEFQRMICSVYISHFSSYLSDVTLVKLSTTGALQSKFTACLLAHSKNLFSKSLHHKSHLSLLLLSNFDLQLIHSHCEFYTGDGFPGGVRHTWRSQDPSARWPRFCVVVGSDDFSFRNASLNKRSNPGVLRLDLMSSTQSLGSLNFSPYTNFATVAANFSLAVRGVSRIAGRTCDQEKSSWAILATFKLLCHFFGHPIGRCCPVAFEALEII